jgi:polysaccharide export outer membrane protein
MRTAARLDRFALLACVALLGACTGRYGGMPTATAPLRGDSALSLRPGDVIKIQVWQHEELSGEFPIDENFNLLFPIMGELSVRGLSVQELRTRIRAELGRLFTNPYVAVIPLFRVAVLGEVNRPGLYSVDPTLSVYDLVALAGGPLRAADDRDLRLIRAGELYPLPLNAVSIAQSTLRELGVRSGDQLLVPRKALTREDWVLLLQMGNLAVGIAVLLVR